MWRPKQQTETQTHSTYTHTPAHTVTEEEEKEKAEREHYKKETWLDSDVASKGFMFLIFWQPL